MPEDIGVQCCGKWRLFRKGPPAVLWAAIAWFQTEKDWVRVCKLWDKRLMIHIVRMSTLSITKSPRLVLNRLVLTEICKRQRMDAVFGTASGWPCISSFCKFWHLQVAVSRLLLVLFTQNLEILLCLVCTLWSIVANPIMYRLVPSPSRFEIRQCNNDL